MKYISVIIPVYNHEQIIYKNINRIINHLKSIPNIKYELLIINDGSRDNTMQKLDCFSDEHIIINKVNNGLGSVIALGICKARGDYLVFVDLDLSYGLDNIQKVIELSDEWDCIVCSKYKKSNNYPFIRKTLSNIHFLINRLFFKANVRDMGSGIVLVRAQLLRNIKLKSKGFGVHCEFFLFLTLQKARTIEIPVDYQHHPGSYRLFYHSFQTVIEIICVLYRYFIVSKLK